MQLLDINKEEEDRDRVKVALWMSKYNKLFRILFNKYSNTIRTNVDDNFVNKQSKYLNLGEIFKFLKDHEITNELLTKDEAQAIVRLLTMKRKKSEEVNTLDFENFQQFFI